MKNFYYKAIIEPQTEGGFTAFVPKLPGCVSEGETYDETLKNIQEAINLYLEVLMDKKQPISHDNTHISEVHVAI